MEPRNSWFSRVHENGVHANLPRASGNDFLELITTYFKRTETSNILRSTNGSELVQRRVFAEDYEQEKSRILDPGISRWGKIFLTASIVSLFVDPMFLYLPIFRGDLCIENGRPLQVILTIIRSVADIFYVIQIFVRFNTAYDPPSSHVLTKGDQLIMDPSKVALRYIRRGFWIDILAALPIPQVLVWVIIPNVRGALVSDEKNSLWYIMIIQDILRVVLIYPLTCQIIDATGVIQETAWAGAAYNLMLYMLGSHVSGAWYYLQTIARQEACWTTACDLEKPYCQDGYFDCKNVDDLARMNWFKSTNVSNLCTATVTTTSSGTFYQFGIYSNPVALNVPSTPFINKYLYCFWWGLQTISSMGNALYTSTYVAENVFSIIVVTIGLVLFAFLIGNMQKYLQSASRKLEEWRVKRADTEIWMDHRDLPPELKESIRHYDRFMWLATKWVDEEAILNDLPIDLRRKIKGYLCQSLVRQVPLFNEMDETTVDAVCERLKPTYWTESMFLLKEGHPVNQMFFIIRGRLDSYTTDGGRPGFFNSCKIGPGDFCGEELLTWALNPHADVVFPFSTRTVKATTEVEAFALVAEDLKFVASIFRRLHTKQLRHTFKFYSHQWRTWAACFIQAAWRRHKKLKKMAGGRASEREEPPQGTFWSRYAETLLRNMGLSNSGRLPSSSAVSSLQKPVEPDFD